jgi:hypothetical protein
VISATPGTDGSAISRFTLRFSDPMAPLGSRTSPIKVDCPVAGAGRWVDPLTFVWEFAEPLPGGLACKAELKDDLETIEGRDLEGARSFSIDSGGPYGRAVLRADQGAGIEEDQIFIVAANGPVDRASVEREAYCAIEGIGERIAVDLLPGNVVDEVLVGLGDTWDRRHFLEQGGILAELSDAPAERAKQLANVVALKCRRPLPPGQRGSLVWPESIRAPGGRTAGESTRFHFTVRQEFTAKLTCPRVNPRAGCDPIKALKVQFSAPVPRASALATRLDVGGGQMLAPVDEGKDRTLSEIRFKPPLPPGSKARLVLPDGLRDETGRLLANARRFPLEFDIAPIPPLVKFPSPFGIIESKQGATLPVTVRGVEPELAHGATAIAGGTARIEANDAVIASWLRRVHKAQEDDIREVGEGDNMRLVNHTGETSLFKKGEQVQRSRLPLPGKGREFEVVGIPLDGPGFYVVELASPELGNVLLGRPATRHVSAAALVTDMSVHFKWGRAGSLVWVTSLDDGKPVAGAAIRVTDSCGGKELASGTTDKSGRLTIATELPEPTTNASCDNLSHDSPPLIVSARKGGDFSFTMTDWTFGIQPYDFDLPYGWSEQKPILHSILDRTLLRAGETIHMKHVYRAPVPSGIRSAGALEGTLVLSHYGSGTQFELPFELGADGIGENEWTPPKGAPMGDYGISAVVGEETIQSAQSFRVDEYRLPSMRASVSGPRTPSVRPRNLPLDLYVGYLSGGGASKAPVRVRTAFEKLSDDPDGWEDWTFGGSPVREGTSPLDEDHNDGDAPQLPSTSTLPLQLDENGALRTTMDMPALADAARMIVEMDYQDANGETLTASTSIPVYTSNIRLGLKPNGWLHQANDMRVKIAALDLAGRPIRGQRVALTLYTREILSARRRLIGGFYAYDNSATTKRIEARCDAVTDAGGIAHCRVNPDVSGEVIVVATTVDREGNEARAVTTIYLAGNDDWWFGGDNGDRMDILPDARAYRAGDTARVQVRMPFRKATALVTVEREGVLSSFVTRISGKNPVIKVPLPGSYAPDVFISVIAVRGRVATWKLVLAEFAQEWGLPFFNPKMSNPTSLVDLAKPSYRIGMTKVKVGWEANELKVAVKPERETYRVREQAQVAIQVKGANGRVPASAEVAFAAVDEALLQLSPNESWKLLDVMMAERPLSVLTSTGQMQVVGKRHYGRKALPHGGGGGGDLSALTRADFKPVLLWKGRIALDAKGRALVEVPMADTLSAYRLVAIATAGEDRFGTGSAQIRTVQDLTIFSGIPPLVRSGDEYAATFTLKNGTGKPMEVTAALDLDPEAGAHQPINVTVPAGGAVPVSWTVTAPADVAQLRWTLSARSSDGRGNDRIQVDQQVIPPVPEEVWGAYFLRAGPGANVPIEAPAGMLPGRGGVEVRFTSSPAPALEGVRDYMRRYPHGCFEQRLSIAVALGDRGLWDKQVADLPAYMAPDGLLRYFPSDLMPGSVVLTSYALSITADAGLPWPDERKERMIEALESVVDGRLAEEAEGPIDLRLLRVHALAALARNGASTPQMLGQARIKLRDMPTATLAEWIVILDKTPGTTVAERTAAETMLRGRIVYEGTRLDLVDRKTAPWWMMVSDDEVAMKALNAVIGRRGWEGDAARMMIGVALRQQRGHWDTTPSNAWGVVTTQRFAKAYPGAVAGITTARFSGQMLSRKWGDSAPMRFALPATRSPLLLTHSTSPAPWANVSLRAAVPLCAPAFSGYRVSRQVSFLDRQKPGKLSRGDVLKVRLTIEAPVDRTWVVVEDPIPAGASIVSGTGGQSALFAGQASGGDSWPSYIERSFDAWRAYFGWLPQGRSTVEYAVRINNEGRFQLPPTRVEAMYSPEINAALPNQPLIVGR